MSLSEKRLEFSGHFSEKDVKEFIKDSVGIFERVRTNSDMDDAIEDFKELAGGELI